jgi:hypothetical protein
MNGEVERLNLFRLNFIFFLITCSMVQKYEFFQIFFYIFNFYYFTIFTKKHACRCIKNAKFRMRKYYT